MIIKTKIKSQSFGLPSRFQVRSLPHWSPSELPLLCVYVNHYLRCSQHNGTSWEQSLCDAGSAAAKTQNQAEEEETKGASDLLRLLSLCKRGKASSGFKYDILGKESKTKAEQTQKL